jgi:type III restriction enzyme
MKLHFDSKQEFQLDAIKAITDIFEGQPLSGSDFEFSIAQPGALLTENGIFAIRPTDRKHSASSEK